MLAAICALSAIGIFADVLPVIWDFDYVAAYEDVEVAPLTLVLSVRFMALDFAFSMLAALPLIVLVYLAFKRVAKDGHDALRDALKLTTFFRRSLLLFAAISLSSVMMDYFVFETHELFLGVHNQTENFYFVSFQSFAFDILVLVKFGFLAAQMVFAAIFCCWPLLPDRASQPVAKRVFACAEVTLGYLINRIVVTWSVFVLLKYGFSVLIFDVLDAVEPSFETRWHSVFQMDFVTENIVWAALTAPMWVVFSVIIARAYLTYEHRIANLT